MVQIPEEEKQRRRTAMQSILGSHAMEGLFPDEASSSLINRYIEGELTLEQFSQSMDEHGQKLLTAHRNMAGAA
jgi:Antitoxin VbhA